MKRFAPWLIVLYVLTSTVGGGLHILFVDEAPVVTCDESRTHLCGHVLPHHDHDAHTCSTCQGWNLKDAVAAGGAPAVADPTPAGRTPFVVRLFPLTAARRPDAARAPPVSA